MRLSFYKPDFNRMSCLVEPRLERAIHTQDSEPVFLVPLERLGLEVNVSRTVAVLLDALRVVAG